MPKFLGFCDDSAHEILNSLNHLDVGGSCVSPKCRAIERDRDFVRKPAR